MQHWYLYIYASASHSSLQVLELTCLWKLTKGDYYVVSDFSLFTVDILGVKMLTLIKRQSIWSLLEKETDQVIHFKTWQDLILTTDQVHKKVQLHMVACEIFYSN